ncbi:hypothetical protein [Roseivivax marinus]|nr:hypothetical protein [Roseivivax marinus]
MFLPEIASESLLVIRPVAQMNQIGMAFERQPEPEVGILQHLE